MTVNQMFKAMVLHDNQTVKIQDCAKNYTYESDTGFLTFEDSFDLHEDIFEGYNEFVEYIRKLKVDWFTVGNDCITIWTE